MSRQHHQARRTGRQDVARAAGVSVTTVTHALNPPPGVRMDPATRDRVRRIARELGYRPSFVGRALVAGRSFAVGLLQPTRATLMYPFYQAITLGLSEAMESADYLPLVLFRSAEGRHLRVIRQGRVDGMLVLQSERDAAPIREVAATGLPTVAVNVHYESLPGEASGCVHSDHRRMLCEAVGELVGLGCRRLLVFHDHRVHDANATLQEAFAAEVARRVGEGITGRTVVPASGVALAGQCRELFLAEPGWDGVLVDGARVAEALVQAGLALGRVPRRDYRLVVAETDPGRTTSGRWEESVYAHQPQEVGRSAWRLLSGLMDGSASCREVLVPYRRDAIDGQSGAECAPQERTDPWHA